MNSKQAMTSSNAWQLNIMIKKMELNEDIDRRSDHVSCHGDVIG